MTGRSSAHSGALKRLLTAAARASLSAGGGLDRHVIIDVCERVGIHVHSFHQIFPTEDDLFDAVHKSIVEDCNLRLRAGIDRFEATDSATKYMDAARALAEAWPIERGGMTIRADRRARALAGSVNGPSLLASERRFVQSLQGILADLIYKIGRAFDHSPALATRVILDTFERSFEAWILEGHSESRFGDSPYVGRTLPTLLEQLSSARTN